MKKIFTIIAALIGILPVFSQNNSRENAQIAQTVADKNAWAKPPKPAEDATMRPRPLIHYAFTIAEPTLEVEESLDGSVQSGLNEYLIAYSSATLEEVLSDLLQRPSLYFEVNEALKPTLQRELGIFYKNLSIKPAEAQRLILSKLAEIYSLKIEKKPKLKDVWLLSVADLEKFASWTATGRINDNTEWLPSSMTVDKKGLYYGQSNDMTTLAAGLEKFSNQIFVTESSLKAQISVERLPTQSMTDLTKILLDQYGIAMKKVKKMVNIVEITAK